MQFEKIKEDLQKDENFNEVIVKLIFAEHENFNKCQQQRKKIGKL